MNQMCGVYKEQAANHHEADTMSVSCTSTQAPERLQGPTAEGRQQGTRAQTGATTWGSLQPWALASQGPHRGETAAHHMVHGFFILQHYNGKH